MARHQPTPKINKAFNKLMDFNILAKKDWACCQTCGHAEMDEYLNTFNKHYRIGSLELKNYIFFHDQDRENLDSVGSTYLAYDLDEKAKMTVMQVLKDHGLNPEWDGNQNKRIKITERKTRNGVGKEEKTKRGTNT
ncbi:DUF6891 domain-containing protein [Candidatus Pelagibacter bacterium nBUS_44]|uniref:DUF6891 domain-containing protein n=1 Tax=Candidatus Pelagibacter bacterium nBUS_44 TaxID=3374195 RepID=UPI003EC10C11